MPGVATGLVDPEAMLVALAREHPPKLLRVDHPRLGPRAVMHPPQVLGAAFGAATVGERDAIDLAHAPRKDAGDDRMRAIHRCDRVTDFERAHFLPAGARPDLRVERLRF